MEEAEELILKEYNGSQLPDVYKGYWKSRFREYSVMSNLDVKSDSSDHWEKLVSQLRYKINAFNKNSKSPKTTIVSPTESPGSSSTKDQKKIDSSIPIKVNYTLSRTEKQNWRLSSGTFVEDQMLRLIEKTLYEHPVHSLILDPTENFWKSYFSDDELMEIRCHNIKLLPNLTEEMKTFFQQFELNNKTALDFYEVADYTKAHPVNEFDKKWNDQLVIDDCSEADLLHSVWEFVYKLYKQKNVKAKLGERVSKSVSVARNSDRAVEAVERRPRKIVGAKLDILFRSGLNELGSCEIGKHDVEENDDKYINDGLLKLPKALRDILASHIRLNDDKRNKLVSVGYLMMGIYRLSMELVIMDVPEGKHVTRITKTKKFPFPEAMDSFSVDFLSLLELAWKGREMMIENLAVLYGKKRKVAQLMTDEDDVHFLFGSRFKYTTRGKLYGSLAKMVGNPVLQRHKETIMFN
ncbi:hypothetical protein MFLAVUS_006283 [Mucor flavus]|uniref:Uncharacterized protein n=1 Tax=Mucor flavus TaxID=439312 RepID=A0ABP9Z143_9FUNG